MDGKIFLRKSFFTEKKQQIFKSGSLYAETFLYSTGVEALTIGNDRGHITMLPYMGQIVWDAVFDGVDLTMKNMFKEPVPARVIVETYGCYMYHSGILRNGCPGPDDTHPLHGEMPCARMNCAELVFGEDEKGSYLGLLGSYEYVMGFGDHYMAVPSVKLRQGSALMDIRMDVENLSSCDMELMYMCHMNQAFEKGAKIIQPADYTPENVFTRTSIPGHVKPTENWLDFLNKVKEHPELMSVLDDPDKYDPEFVFFIRNLKKDTDNNTHLIMKRENHSSYYVSFDTNVFTHMVRWILCNDGQQVAAFALPATCEPEGYAAEKQKGNVKILGPGEKRSFRVVSGFLSPKETESMEQLIKSLV